MPIYEYHCPKCGDFEAMQKMSDPELTHCPTCRRKVRKLISSTSFQLKGSGWYITDYARKGGGGKDKKGDKAADKTSTGDTTSSSDTASATKSGDDKPTGGDKPSGGKTGSKASTKAEAA
jgi:putative FmdB family regulatory protein